ncbi:MAG: sugar phosphate isomerase/epimerase, partial [Pirellulales bacterium]
TDPDRVMVGDGPIDLAGEIQALRDIGYQRTISLELFNAELWDQDPLQVAQLGRQRLETLLDE